jgi:transcriptional regulator with XRE-family HTH domain
LKTQDEKRELKPLRVLRSYRALRGMTLEELSLLSGLSVSRINRIETGRLRIRPEEVDLFASLLCAPSEILQVTEKSLGD